MTVELVYFMQMHKCMPQFELSQNSVFKNIVIFKPSFGICLYIACVPTSPIGDQHWWQLVPIAWDRSVAMATEPRLLKEDLGVHTVVCTRIFISQFIAVLSNLFSI